MLKNNTANKVKIIFFVLILVFLFTFNSFGVSALTGSIRNARMILYPEVGFFGTSIEKTILVENVNDVPVKVLLENSGKIIKLIDKEFILEAGTNKKARFKINLRKPGDYEERINVFFESFEEKKPGVVLSSTIIIHAKKKGDWNEDDVENGNDLNEGNIVEDNANDVPDQKDKIPLEIIVATISTLFLAALLILLVMILNKKLNKKIKRRGRSL